MVTVKKLIVVVFGLSFMMHPFFAATDQIGTDLKLKIDALKDPLLNVLKLDAKSLKTDLDKNLAAAQKALTAFTDVMKAAPAVIPSATSDTSKSADAPKSSDTSKSADTTTPPAVTSTPEPAKAADAAAVATPQASDTEKPAENSVPTPASEPVKTPDTPALTVTPAPEAAKPADTPAPAPETHAPIEVK